MLSNMSAVCLAVDCAVTVVAVVRSRPGACSEAVQFDRELVVVTLDPNDLFGDFIVEDVELFIQVHDAVTQKCNQVSGQSRGGLLNLVDNFRDLVALAVFVLDC